MTAPIRVGLAAAWCDVSAAQRLAERLSRGRLKVELICAGAPEAKGEAPPPDVVLVLWSPGAKTSLFVGRAVEEARARGRLVEALLSGEAPKADRPAPPMTLGPRPTLADIARLAARLTRAAQGRPQQSAVVALTGPLVLAALAAAAAAPFIWLATQEPQTQVADAMEDDRPRPTTQAAPDDPAPEGNGMGGPLIAPADEGPKEAP